eukprot:15444730-Alexandrium_andersonii.AAC.1
MCLLRACVRCGALGIGAKRSGARCRVSGAVMLEGGIPDVGAVSMVSRTSRVREGEAKGPVGLLLGIVARLGCV